MKLNMKIQLIRSLSFINRHVMKNRLITFISLIILVSAAPLLQAQDLSATEIVRKADEKFKGEQTGYSVMTMTIVRPAWQRTVEFKSWAKESDYALTLITAPAREKGQSFLKRKNEMWSWNPAINRLMDGIRLYK
jgi:hypothetical protein